MVASSDSDMKSVKSSVNGNGDSAAYKSLELDLSAISELSAREDDSLEEMYERLDDYDEQQQRKKERGQQLVQQHLQDVHKDAERATGRKEKYLEAKVTGYEPVPPTGDKKWDKHIAEGQRLHQLRALPAGPGNPSYISELTKDPVKLERQREYLGWSQAASSSGPARYDIGTTSERKNYLQSLSFTKLKEEAKASNVRVPTNLRKSDRLELIDKLLKK